MGKTMGRDAVSEWYWFSRALVLQAKLQVLLDLLYREIPLQQWVGVGLQSGLGQHCQF